jgi:hypothetical protein
MCAAMLLCHHQVVITNSRAVWHASCVRFGQAGLLVDVLADAPALAVQAADWANQAGLWGGVGPLLLVSGYYEANADMMPTLQVINVHPPPAEPADKDLNAAADVAAAAAAAAATPAARQAPEEEEHALFADGPDLARQMSDRMSSRSGRRGSQPQTGGAGAGEARKPLLRQFSKAS